jgi:hypothetical protein
MPDRPVRAAMFESGSHTASARPHSSSQLHTLAQYPRSPAPAPMAPFV